MQMTAREIARLLNGTTEGNPDVVITRPSSIEEGGAGTLTFLADAKYLPHLYTTTAAAVLVDEDFRAEKPVSATLIRVKNVRVAVATLLQQFSAQSNRVSGVSPQAHIDAQAKTGENTAVGHFAVIEAGAQIGENCVLHPQVFVGRNVKIGDNCTLHSGVKIYADCIIGNNVILHANAVVGSDGFGFAPQADGTFKKIPQVGNVIIEDDVEVGANTVIDRAALDATIIRRGAKLDNLIQIAHNVEIGENTVIAAQAGIAGSTKIGKNNQIGGQVGIVGHISTADGVRIQAQSGVNRKIKEEGKAVYGSPAMAYNDFLRAFSIFKKLPEVEKRLRKLEE